MTEKHIRPGPMPSSQKVVGTDSAVKALKNFSLRLNSDSPSSYRLAKMYLIGQMLEMKEYPKLVSSLVSSPNDLEYYKALLHGSNFTMNTGGNVFDRVEKVLIGAYENGADLSGLLPVLKERLTATYASKDNIDPAFTAHDIMGGFINSISDGKPSQKEVAKTLLYAAISINLDSERRVYQAHLVESIKLKLMDAVAFGILDLPEKTREALGW